MRKVAINREYGGFGLSEAAQKRYMELTGKYYETYDDDFKRDDPILIGIIEEYGEKICSGAHCKLKIVEIPDDVDFVIEEYDGLEWVSEKHRTWS